LKPLVCQNDEKGVKPFLTVFGLFGSAGQLSVLGAQNTTGLFLDWGLSMRVSLLSEHHEISVLF
jgi:hypothetical protein